MVREKTEKIKRVSKLNVSKKRLLNNNYDNLFDFIKVFFGNNSKYKEVNDYQKKKHFFMLQRFMSIRYPDTAQKFNINKINPVAVVNLWKLVANKYNRTPIWIFTKVKKQQIVKEKSFIPSEDTINFYLRYHKISKRDLKDAMKFNRDIILNELEKIEKLRNDNE